MGFHTVREGRAGGVTVLLKYHLNVEKIEQVSFANDCIEICTVKVKNSSSELFVCGIYRPQSSRIENFSSQLESFLNGNILKNSNCIIGGDFNINLFSDSDDVGGFTDMMRSHHYLQTITDVTRPSINQSAPSLIDHIWLNRFSNYSCGILRTGVTDHHTLYLQVPFASNKSNIEKNKKSISGMAVRTTRNILNKTF